jgi:hypothetical protein
MIDVLKNQKIYIQIFNLISLGHYDKAKALAEKASQDCEKEMIKFEEYMKKENGYE